MMGVGLTRSALVTIPPAVYPDPAFDRPGHVTDFLPSFGGSTCGNTKLRPVAHFNPQRSCR
jgi:hypothetical protein